jgi:hypothetical protein
MAFKEKSAKISCPVAHKKKGYYQTSRIVSSTIDKTSPRTKASKVS